MGTWRTGLSHKSVSVQTVGFTAGAGAFALMTAAAVGADIANASRWVSVLRSRPLRACGTYSHAIYVFHKPLHDLVGQPLLASMAWDITHSVVLNVIYISAVSAVVFCCALVSTRFVEEPLLRKKDCFAPLQ
jgi:peptidoglycan/LPS O-acetylase OafA/YrhL